MSRLTSLLLDGNLLMGPVPALPQTTLPAFDVSGNRLSRKAVIIAESTMTGVVVLALLVAAASLPRTVLCLLTAALLTARRVAVTA